MVAKFSTSLNRIVRDMERASRAAARQQQQQIRAELQNARAYKRAQAAEAKEQQRLYVESRIADVASQNEDVDQSVAELNELLAQGLKNDPAINFEKLLVMPRLSQLNLGNLLIPLPPPSRHIPAKQSAFIMWLPWVRNGYSARIEAEQRAYEKAMFEYGKAEAERQKSVETKHLEHEQKMQTAKAEADTHNAEVNAWKTAFEACQTDAVIEYFKAVLSNSAYPDGFSQNSKVLYIAPSKQLVVEYDLPEMEAVVSTVKSYKYVKAGDNITETMRPESQRRAIYTSVVAQTTLRSIWELFESDARDFVETIVFNGYVDTINPGTGKRVRPCIVTVRTTKDAFSSLDLQHVEAVACLRTLNASFSKSPAELAPVRPILELNMVDPRFIPESDVLSTLDQRSNLMDLTPSEFESLITNLFQKMGLDTKLTQASRDGGVDCVAFDPRPIFGGKVVIQAKRYKNTVGVSAVRDLFGTMQNEGASKGILVTTSGYGKAAFEFANGKPIELLDGGNLLYLLKEHTSIDAKIVMPDEWQDIALDNGL